MPFRLSLAGGSSDYPKWYLEHGGAVITSTINKYCYIFARYLPPFFEHKHRIVYSKIELPYSLDEINHPSVRECLKFMEIQDGIEIHHAGDLPARSGIGSSSAFTVGLLHALHHLKGQEVDKYKLALEAIHVEQNLIKENVGSQDQCATAIGGFNYIKFGNHEPLVKKLEITDERLKKLESCLMLCYTGLPHFASSVASSYDFKARENEIRGIMEFTNDTYAVLTRGAVQDYGWILHETWSMKRKISPKVTSPYIDYIYKRALELGATGGRLIGAGGSGFMVLFCEPDKQKKLRESDPFNNLLFVPFKFETGTEVGSRIISQNGD